MFHLKHESTSMLVMQSSNAYFINFCAYNTRARPMHSQNAIYTLESSSSTPKTYIQTCNIHCFMKSWAQNARARMPCVLKMQFRPRIGVSPPQKHIFRHATCIVSLNLVLKMRARASCVLKCNFDLGFEFLHPKNIYLDMQHA